MVYAYDQWLQMPVKDLYDTQMMAMSIQAAKDMYDKGQKRIDDFYTKYGDFMSPFAKDMERYGEIVGGIGDIINDAYARGIDPLRSQEGRALVAQAIRSVNPAEINAMRANAKMGYAYQDALQALRKAGKYSQEQEDFDIAQTGGPSFNDFATANGQGGFNSWDRSSPIQATSLRELTQDSYKGRTPRTLTREDFKNDPRLAGKYAYDPRYEWTGYLDSDLMKVAPGASASIAGDPRAAFFREQARQMVIASGKKPTAENVEAQFQRNIANANEWALIDPTRQADEFAKMATEFSYRSRLQQQDHDNKMDEIREQKGGNTDDNYNGNYVRAISGDARTAAYSAGVRLGIDHGTALNAISKKYKNNPAAAEKAKNDAITEFFFHDKRYGDGHQSISQIIKNLPDNDDRKHKSVGILNGILKNFAANSDNVNNGKYLLEKAGFVYNEAEKHWEPFRNVNSKIVSPHELMRNIINFQFTGQLKGTSKKQLIKKLEKSAGGYESDLWDHIGWRSPGAIAVDAKAIYPDAADHGVMIAPDETGKNKLWVRVGISKVGHVSGGDKDRGYWLQVPIDYGKDLAPTSTSEASIYSSGVHERKDYGNAAVTSEFNSMR